MNRRQPARPRTGHPMLMTALAAILCGGTGGPGGRAADPLPPDEAPATRCAADAISRSACMIRLVLEDVEARYGGVNEGGISGIVAASSTSYVVSLPREGRIQRYTYAFRIEGGSIRLVGRVPSVRSF